MNEPPAVHPSADQLRAFGQGLLNDAAMDQVAEHVAQCDDCCRKLGDLPDDTLLARLKNADTHAPPDETLAPVSVRPVLAPQGVVPAALRDHPRYRVLKYIGRGGMGDVFQAEHRVMRKLVALKVIRPELLTNTKAVQRFQQEVQAAASLNHRNIVTATDAEQAEDVHFLVMEYVEGQSLDRVVEQRGPLPVLHACNYARQAALGLQHAHERELVHRDIKPHNLMLTRRGEIKILDFGLARLNRLTGAREADPSLTTHGATLGTPDYIAPEQIRDARSVDARADLYSLGATLYFLLTGSVPFPADTAIEKMRLHLTARPLPIDRFRSDVPAELASLVQSLLAKEPADRPASALEVARLLEPLATR
ncbi:MAG: protein kinase, partial [Pirellulaceae bacterium]|nr:protein kinase [Pirellulaceae bacterium]